MIAIRQSILGLRLISKHVVGCRKGNLVYPCIEAALKHKINYFQATVAFGVSTIVLGVDNANLRSEIEDLKTTTTAEPTTPVVTTTPTTTSSGTITTPTPPSSTTEGPIDMSKYRLPNTIKPSVYDLYLYPDLETGLFKGRVIVSVDVLSETDTVVLHSHLLTIDNVMIDGSVVGTFVLEPRYELLVIRKADNTNFTVGNSTVDILFNGNMKDRIVGLYTSSYTTSTGESRQIATSKFEPTYARQAFPCFDEPNLKAKYIVHLLKPKDESYIALSNYPVNNIEDYDETHDLVTFDETVSMSTYLSCFIVSDFKHTENVFTNKDEIVPLNVYASPENLNKTTYAGEVGKKIIEFYVNYFDIPYPLPKLDMVAIPDFVSGAMEHWGLVTYRETALLYTSTTHSSSNKQRVATVIAHELAHSWFGNLVTMDWWNDLWLNEGFANYIEYKGVLAAEPTWGMLDQFLISDLHSVLSLDATLSSHPIVQTVLTPDEITEIFDTISYNKGASVLRMLEATVGEENFRKGVTNYLNKYNYSNAVTENFLTEIQGVVGDTIEIAQMMDTFTVQMGYPLLTVSVDGNSYRLTQTRFLKDPDAAYDPSETPYGYKWTIPITYVTDLGKSTEIHMFKYTDENITIQRPDGANWIKFNYDQVGYYRVTYPEAEWNSIISNYENFSTADRTHLLEELFSLAEAGVVLYSLPLDLTKKFENEIGYTPWNVANSKLDGILTYLAGSGSEQETAFKAYISSIVTPAYGNLSWVENEDDEHLKRLARIQVLTLACTAGHVDCLLEAENQFNTWIQDQTPLSQDLRSLIYKFGTKGADEDTWLKLLEIYKSENDASEKLKLVNGLANVQNTTLLSNLVELTKNESIVRGQDFFTVLQYISSNPAGTSLIWDWVRANWEYLVERFTLNDRYLGSLIPAITNRFATAGRLAEMEEFFGRYPEAGAGTANRAKALENVRNNIRWLAQHKSTVEAWISSNSIENL